MLPLRHTQDQRNFQALSACVVCLKSFVDRDGGGPESNLAPRIKGTYVQCATKYPLAKLTEERVSQTSLTIS